MQMFGHGDARRESLAITGGYVFLNGAIAVFLPFAAQYYQSLGFTGWKVGLLTSLPAIGAVLTGPLWGGLADRLGAHRSVMRVALLVAALMSFLLAGFTGFVPVLLGVWLMSWALVPVPSLLDSFAVNQPSRGGAPYGTMRMFGSLGFVVVVVLMGRILGGNVTNVIFFAYPIFHLLTALTTVWFPSLGEKSSQSIRAGIGMVTRNPEFVLLLVTAFLLMTTMSAYMTYLGMRVSVIGGDSGVTGLAMGIGALTEVPFIYFGNRLLERFGARRMILIAIGAYVVRYAIVAFLPGTTPILVAALLHGAGLGTFLVASVTLASRLAPAGYQATAQAVLGTMSNGLGSIVGSFGGGVLAGGLGTGALFKIIVVIAIGALAVYAFGERWTKAETEAD